MPIGASVAASTTNLVVLHSSLVHENLAELQCSTTPIGSSCVALQLAVGKLEATLRAVDAATTACRRKAALDCRHDRLRATGTWKQRVACSSQTVRVTDR